MLFQSNVEKIIQESIKLALDKEDELNAKNIQKKVDYYNGNWEELKEYVKTYLDFEPVELKDMPWQIANITRKVIQKNSFCYKKPPTRKIEGSDKNQNKYDELTFNKNKYLRITERQANLLFDIAFFVGWDNENNRFLYKPPIRQFKPVFGEDDMINPTGLIFPVNNGLNKEAKWEYWTADTIYYIIADKNGLWRLDPKNPSVENEYHFLNFLFIHKGELIDDFHTGNCDDLINANEILNLSLTILNYLERDTSYKQVTATGIQKTDKIVARYNRILASTDEKAEFGLLDLQTSMDNNIEKIKFNIALVLNNWNMEPKWATEGEGAPSGFSLVVKNMDLLEAWEQAIPIWREVEDQIFEMENKVLKAKKKNIQFTGFNVNFSDISFPIEKSEQRADWDWQLQHGYISDLDIMRKLDIDGTDEELKAKLEENKSRIGELKTMERPKPVTFGERLKQFNINTNE